MSVKLLAEDKQRIVGHIPKPGSLAPRSATASTMCGQAHGKGIIA
jgi:hypothetical protein